MSCIENQYDLLSPTANLRMNAQALCRNWMNRERDRGEKGQSRDTGENLDKRGTKMGGKDMNKAGTKENRDKAGTKENRDKAGTSSYHRLR